MKTVIGKVLNPQVLSFLGVGSVGYVVDVGAFNVLWGAPPFDETDPSVAKVVAVALAMVVTYLGNKLVTWRGKVRSSLRQILQFIVFNVIGLGFSVVTLWISHDLLDLTTRLDDNISANVIGLALGTAFRYWTYQYFVFDRSDALRMPRDAEALEEGPLEVAADKPRRHRVPGRAMAEFESPKARPELPAA